MAATLSSELQNTDKVVIFVEECRQLAIDVLPPDVNAGDFAFTVNAQDQIIYGLGAIKGVGEGPVEAIVAAREQGGDFKNLFDFCARVDTKKLNKRAIDALIRAGAMDTIGPHRNIMLAAMLDAIKVAEKSAANTAARMEDMFGLIEAEVEVDVYALYDQVPEAALKERLAGEKDTLGLYLTGHPIDEFEAEVQQVVSMRLGDLDGSVEELKRSRRGNIKTFAGLVMGVRTRQTQRGETMAIVTLDDRTGRLEMTLFGEAYAEFKHLMVVDTVVVVEAEAGWDDYNDRPRIRAQKVYTLVEARQALIKGVEFKVEAAQAQAFLAKLKALVRSDLPEDRGCTVWIRYANDWAQGEVMLHNRYRIPLEDETLHALKQSFGATGYKFRYQ
jgi:DNA polymerase-3 subunit alpha